MKKTLKTETLKAAYDILNAAKLTKLSTDDKLRALAAMRALKPAARSLEEATKDAVEKLKPEGFDQRLARAQAYEARLRQGADAPDPADELSDAQYKAILNEAADLNRTLAKALKDLAERDVTLTLEPLSAEAIAGLIEAGDWTLAQAMTVSEVVGE